jgi:hypothetical protein
MPVRRADAIVADARGRYCVIWSIPAMLLACGPGK